MTANTIFATTDNYVKGGVEITGKEDPSHYLFSNMFDVAAHAKPWERIVVAKNLEFTIECMRAEGESPWFACAHDETALVMQGSLSMHFLQPSEAEILPPADKDGAVVLAAKPAGAKMGHVKATRGHLTLLPANAAYQFQANEISVVLIQSVLGDVSVEKWADICQR
ncbi:MAG: hydroxyquinol 1,2-dioxygenase [Gammaproteobacteria bacterium]